MASINSYEKVSFGQLFFCMFWETLKMIVLGIIVVLSNFLTPVRPDKAFVIIRFWLKISAMLDKKIASSVHY
ncbi:hypothetical protein DCCM_2645 [Desulfocucumis palustris]|uniref:Uncharacterized protein n=1 Tax=Desulfocucumis palustris TaxID=1898651 RepID=A0A2L2XCV2_9FIRM|nr:hypothetical protein DCCM_2645 [Desulfocucumis palustris]